MKTTLKILAFALIFLVTVNIQAQESYKLEYKFEKGKTYRYKDVTSGSMTQEMMGREMKMRNESNTVVKLVVDNLTKDKNIVLLISADSARVFSSSPRGDTTIYLKELIGKRTKVTISNLGKITNRETIDTVEISGGRLTSAAQREALKFPILSEKPVKVGDSWSTANIDTMDQMGGKIIVTSDVEYKVVGKEKKNGTDCLKMTFNGKSTTEGKGVVQGMEFFIDGSGKVNGTLYFDVKAGLVIEEESNTDSETNMATTGEQQMIIPMTQTSKSMRTYIK